MIESQKQDFPLTIHCPKCGESVERCAHCATKRLPEFMGEQYGKATYFCHACCRFSGKGQGGIKQELCEKCRPEQRELVISDL